MSRYEDIKKKRSSNPDKEKNQTSTSRYQTIKENRGDRNYGVDDAFISTFIQDAQSLLDSSRKEWSGLSWQSATDKERTQARNDTLRNLGSRSATIRAYLNANKSNIDQDTHKELTSFLDDFEAARSEVGNMFRSAEKYYSQWETEEDYNSYLTEQKEYEKKRSYDLDAAQKEIEDLEKVLEEYNALTRKVQSLAPSSSESIAATKRMAEISNQYGGAGKNGIESAISEKKSYMNQVKHIQEGITLSGVIDNDDFDQYRGYISTESDGLGKLWSQYGLGYEDLTYEYINGAENGMRGEIINKSIAYNADNSLHATDKFTIYDNMNEDEISIYNYYYAKDGKEAAQKYLDSIQETLNHREATKMFSNMEDKTLLELAFGVAAGIDQFESGVKNLLNTEDDYIAQTATQMASGMVREDLADAGPTLPDWLGGASLGQVGYDAITTTANMAPSILTSIAIGSLSKSAGTAFAAKAFAKAGEITGTALMGASAAGNAYQEALNLGYDKSQARAYSTLVGASEAGLQYLLGGIGKLGGTMSGEAVTKLLNGVDNAIFRTAGNMLSEGLEEGLQEILTPWFKNLTLHMDENVNWSEVAYSSLLGALTAGIMEGGSTISGEVNTYRTGKNLQALDGATQRLTELGKTFAADTVAYQLAGRVNENTGAYTMGRLFNEIGATLSEQNVTEITNALVAKGMDAKTARKNAEALAYVVEGGQLSEKQIAAIEANDVLSEVARTTLIDANTTWNQRSKSYNEALKALAEEMTSPKASQTKAVQQSEENTPTSDTVDAQKENGTESHYEVSADGKTIDGDGNTISIQGISSLDNGKLVFELDDGSTIDASNVAYSSQDEALVYEAVASLSGIIDTDTANKMAKHLLKLGGASSSVYVNGIVQAYTFGYCGYGRDAMTGQNTLAATLSDKQRNVAYGLGEQYRDAKVKADQAKAENTTAHEAQKDGGKKASVGKKTVRRRGRVKGYGITIQELNKVFNTTQKQAYAILDRISAVTGIDIVLFQSKPDANGELRGGIVDGINMNDSHGAFSWHNNKIYIDINAGVLKSSEMGDVARYSMLRTFTHEFTHFIEKHNPEQYEIFRELVYDVMRRNGENPDVLIDEYMDKHKGVSRDDASREVVAEAMTDILPETSFIQELAQKHKGIHQKLVEKLKEFVADLKAHFKSIGVTVSKETAAVKEHIDGMVRYADDLVEMFDRIAVQAVENYQAMETAQKNTATKGGVQMQTRSVNGDQVVWIEDNILKENKGQPVHQFIADYIAEHIGEVYTIIESGQKVYIGEDLPGEYTQSKYTQAVLRNNPNIVKAKNRASANLGEMIEIATNRRWEKTKHTHSKDAQYGIYRYDTRFGFPRKDSKGTMVGANIYKAELLIRNASDGKKYLYDIVNIKKDTASSGWLTQRVTSAAGKPAGQKSNVSKNSIRNGSQNVNPKSSKVQHQAKPSSKNPMVLDPKTVTKADIAEMLENVRSHKYADNTYIPVRISTPGIVQERLFTEDLPIIMPVSKVAQAFSHDNGPAKGKNVRGHSLSVDQLIDIVERMDSPDFVYSQDNGRGVEVIRLGDASDNTVVVVEFDNNVNPAYMNGYEGGTYNVSVTTFNVDGGNVGLFMYGQEKGWHEVFNKQKEGDPAKKFPATRPFAVEQGSLNDNVPQRRPTVNNNSSGEQHQDRTGTLTNRDIIAEIDGKTELERAKLKEYQELLEKSREQSQIMADRQRELDELEAAGESTVGKTYLDVLREMNKAKNRRNNYEGQLHRMEEGVLAPLINREKGRVLEKLRNEYGTIPKGEKSVRDDSLPVSVDGKTKVSRTARTVKGAGVTPDEFAELIDTEVVKGGLTYIPITNDEATQDAVEWIKNEGWEAAFKEWHDDVRDYKTGADMFARGALLLNNAANAGDKKAWLEILYDYQLLNTYTGQGMQAARILKQLQPEDNLYMIRRSIKQMVKDMRLKVDIQLDEQLVKRYEEAQTEEDRNALYAQIQQSVANQIPSTFMDKWTALRYVNMLGNPRTQVRNFFGNLMMMGTTRLKDVVATGLEQIAYKASGGKFERSKSLINDRELLKAAKMDFSEVEALVLGDGKYSARMAQSTEFIKGVMEKRKIFKRKWREKYRTTTNKLMEKGDIVFSRTAYAHALANYLQSHGVEGGDFSAVDQMLLDEARLYAIQQAQEATFRDTSALSGWVSTLGRKRTTHPVGRLLSEGTMPFRKTPANMLIRAEEYSPLGILNSVVVSIHSAVGHTNLVNREGKIGDIARAGEQITGSQIVESWAKSLTGTGLFFFGMLLYNAGWLIGGPDDDESEDKFESLNGWQNYSFRIPGTDINVTVDFLSPSVVPMFMGAQMMELIQEDGFQLKDLESALTSIVDPMVEMSMLQGINDTLENVQYSENNLLQIAISASLSYLTQGVTNSWLGQLERGFESSRRSTYVDKNSAMPVWMQQSIGKASAKTPGWDYNQIPYINAWGEEEQNPHVLLNTIYNMLSPSYISKGQEDAVSQELTRLNDVQSDVNVFPSTPEKTYDDRYLSSDEYVALAKAQGQTQRQIMEGMVGSELYEGLPDVYKAKTIELAYGYARESGQIEVLGRDGFTSDWMTEIGENAAEGILKRVIGENIKSMYLGGDISAEEAVKRRMEYHGDTEDEAKETVAYWDFQTQNPQYSDWSLDTVTKYKDLEPDTAAHVIEVLGGLSAEDGYTNVRPVQKLEAIASDSDLSEKDKETAIRANMDSKLEAKYDTARDMGISMGNFVKAYRKYQDTSGEGKKATVIAYYKKTFGISNSKAEKLYDLFAGKK